MRITPRKARLVAGAIRNMSLTMALTTLDKLHKQAGNSIKKTIESGIANAEKNASLSRDMLYIKTLAIDEGPRFKRFRAASRGTAHPYQKQTCHITVILDTKEPVEKTAQKQKKTPVHKKETVPVSEKEAKKKDYQARMEKGTQKEMKSQRQTTKGITTRKILGK